MGDMLRPWSGHRQAEGAVVSEQAKRTMTRLPISLFWPDPPWWPAFLRRCFGFVGDLVPERLAQCLALGAHDEWSVRDQEENRAAVHALCVAVAQSPEALEVAAGLDVEDALKRLRVLAVTSGLIRPKSFGRRALLVMPQHSRANPATRSALARSAPRVGRAAVPHGGSRSGRRSVVWRVGRAWGEARSATDSAERSRSVRSLVDSQLDERPADGAGLGLAPAGAPTKDADLAADSDSEDEPPEVFEL